MHWDNFGWQFWHWWHGWHWYFGLYQWLEVNNFWKSQVAFWVTLCLGALCTIALRPWKAWKKHQQTQEQIADRLDTSTPGGLTDLVNSLHSLLGDTMAGSTPDDNGSDQEDDDERKHHEVEPHGGKGGHGSSVIPDIIHGGGSSAGHR